MFKIILLTLVAAKLVLSIEQPTYQVIQNLGSNAEVRVYGPTKWVGASMRGKVSEFNSDFRGAMFQELFKYISGNNDAQMKIDMTAPVETRFQSMDSSAISQDSDVQMKMKFYVPAAVQNNTPKPLSEKVSIENDPSQVIAAIRFGGFPTLNDYMAKRDELIQLLGDDAKNFDTVNFSTAGYARWFGIDLRYGESAAPSTDDGSTPVLANIPSNGVPAMTDWLTMAWSHAAGRPSGPSAARMRCTAIGR